jgi:hypothetical protein
VGSPCKNIFVSELRDGEVGMKFSMQPEKRRLSQSFQIHRYVCEMQLKQPLPQEVELNGSAEPYVKPRELARMLSIQEGTIQDWYRRYVDFPAIQLPGSIRVRPSEVRAWLEKFTKANRGKEVS